MRPTFLLDMDGVIADFVGQVAKLAPQNYNKAFPDDPDLVAHFGFGTPNQMWKTIDKEGEPFWSDMLTYDWAFDLVEYLKERGEIIVCTSPSANPACAAGKMRWLQKFFGDRFFREFMITPRKEAAAKPGNILIDDTKRNCDKFDEAGGTAILWPMSWNENREHFDRDGIQQFRYLEAQLAAAVGTTDFSI